MVVRNIQASALVVPKIVFGKVALQMLRTNVVINASNAALHNREISLDCVGVHVAANIFIGLMADALIAREMIT